MNFNHSHRNGSTITTLVMCAIVFIAFSFLWLFFFQADALAVAQYELSGGMTSYDRLIGATLITLALYLLQLVVYAITRLSKRTHALTYVPSMLLLAVLGDVSTDGEISLSPGLWWVAIPVVLTLWTGLVMVARSYQRIEEDNYTDIFSRRQWINMLCMAVMMLIVAMVSNTNAVFHYKAHAETALLERDWDKALEAGYESRESDASLTAIRAYALSRKGELGERLFEYPVRATGSDLLFMTAEAHLMRYPADSIYRHLGALPRHGMTATHYLHNMQAAHQATAAVGDYVLCMHLTDRNLDAFVKCLPNYYEVNDSTTLPRHYREALVLYNHKHSRPAFVYHDAVTNEDFDNLQQLEAQYGDYNERSNAVREHYEDSYWYYYEYMR